MDEGADVDDSLALLTRDPRPVIWIRRIGQILVLAEFIEAGAEEVFDSYSLAEARYEIFDRRLFAARDNVLDHCSGTEVTEVQDFTISIYIGDLEELILQRI